MQAALPLPIPCLCPTSSPACGSPNLLSDTRPPPLVWRSSPIIAQALPTGATTATVVVNPPPGTVPTAYTVELCPKGVPSGSTSCIKAVNYPTNLVPFTGLTPGVVRCMCVGRAQSRRRGCFSGPAHPCRSPAC